MEEEGRIAVLAILVGDYAATERVNAALHEFREYVVCRQGIPYKQKQVNVITVVLDAPQSKINALSGKLGMIDKVKSQVLVTK